jgi:hypothetical protein
MPGVGCRSVPGREAGPGDGASGPRRVAEGGVRLAEATGDLGAIAEALCAEGEHERVIVVGLGDKDGFNQQNGPERLRTAMAAVGRRLAKIRAASAQIELSGPLSTGRGKAGKVDPRSWAGRRSARRSGC